MIEKEKYNKNQLEYYLDAIQKLSDSFPSQIRHLFEEIYTWGETVDDGDKGETYIVKLKPQDWRFFYYLLGRQNVDLNHIPESSKDDETNLFKSETGLRATLKAQLKDDYLIEKIIEIIKGYDSKIVWKAKDIAAMLGVDVEKARVNLKLANLEISREKEAIRDATETKYNSHERND